MRPERNDDGRGPSLLCAKQRSGATREGRSVWRALPVLAGLIALTAATSSLAKNKPPAPRRDEPSKAVTGCESVGDGYVKVPGSDTCVRVSGSARSEGAATFNR